MAACLWPTVSCSSFGPEPESDPQYDVGVPSCSTPWGLALVSKRGTSTECLVSCLSLTRHGEGGEPVRTWAVPPLSTSHSYAEDFQVLTFGSIIQLFIDHFIYPTDTSECLLSQTWSSAWPLPFSIKTSESTLCACQTLRPDCSSPPPQLSQYPINF